MSLSTTQYGYIVDPMVPFTDDKGKTIKNGFIRVFMAGTSTPVLTYRNYDGATNQEKIELDNSGRVKHNVIGSKGSLYKVVVYNILHSQENPLLTVDKIAVLGSSINASGATIVTGLDSVTVQEENFLKATVEGTGVELALDPTEVTSEVSTIGAAETAAPDYVLPLLDKTGTGDGKKISLANLFKFALDWISRLATTVTSFASGDFIAVSNTTIGTRKMSKDTLLELTAQNALDSIHSLSDTATEADLVDGNYLAIDGSSGTKKLPANFISACKIINRGETSVATINALSFKQDGWSYTITDSGTLTDGSLAVRLGDVVVWDATTTSWKMLETDNLDVFLQGSISQNDGTNLNINSSIRSFYIPTNNLYSVISVPSGYYIRAVMYYTTNATPPDPESYVTYDGFYKAGTTSVIIPPKSTYFRIVIKKDDGSDFTPSGFVARLNSLDALSDRVNLLRTEFYSEMSGKVDVVGANVIELFTQGSVSTNDGTNLNVSSSIRSMYFTTGGAPFILGGIPSGYYIRAIMYYTTNAAPPDPASYAGYDGLFEPGTRSIVVNPKAQYARIVIKKDDGTDIVPSDIAVSDIHKDSYSDVLDNLYKSGKGKLYGLKLVVTGDSIPHGQAGGPGQAPSSPYPNLVAQALGMTLVNYAIGGSTFAQSSDFGGTFNSYASFVAAEKDTSKIYVVLTGNQTFQNYAYSNGEWSTTATSVRTPISSRYQFMTDDADVVLVAAGTNDFQYNWTALGTMADRTPDTFYGALHYTILGLLDKYLGKQIVFCTPIKRAQTPYTSVDSKNDNDKTLGDYAEIIKEVCAYYSIPVIDLYAQSCLNPSVESQSSLFDSYKTHPYQTGHNMIARVVSGQLMALRGSTIYG